MAVLANHRFRRHPPPGGVQRGRPIPVGIDETNRNNVPPQSVSVEPMSYTLTIRLVPSPLPW